MRPRLRGSTHGRRRGPRDLGVGFLAQAGQWEISKAVIGAADGTGVSTETDDADQPRGIVKYAPTHLTGVATMDADVTRRLSVVVAMLQCPGEAQTLSLYQSDTLG
jgi:hypothetical protein